MAWRTNAGESRSSARHWRRAGHDVTIGEQARAFTCLGAGRQRALNAARGVFALPSRCLDGIEMAMKRDAATRLERTATIQ